MRPRDQSLIHQSHIPNVLIYREKVYSEKCEKYWTVKNVLCHL